MPLNVVQAHASVRARTGDALLVDPADAVHAACMCVLDADVL